MNQCTQKHNQRNKAQVKISAVAQHIVKPILCGLMIVMLGLGIQACGSSPGKNSSEPQNAAANPAAADATSATTATEPTSDTQAAADEAPAKAIEPDGPATIVESCKDEAYNKYEHQARESIKIGLAATKAEKYGVGFRDIEEHNKWSKTFTDLFKSVNNSCTALVNCGKKHAKDNLPKKSKLPKPLNPRNCVHNRPALMT